MGSNICLKLLITSILITILCSAQQEGNATGSSAEMDQMREDFKVKFNKSYGSDSEEERCRKIFIENVNKIKAQNDLYAKGQSSFTTGINQFSDMTHPEFLAKLTCNFNSMKPFSNVTIYNDNSRKLRKEIDWRKKNCVTPVKDQGLCRACWAFAATGALEGLLAVTTGRLVSLSEQQLIDCSRKYANNGCSGGDLRYSFFYATDNGGINSEETYPYEGTDGACRFQRNATAATCDGFAIARGEKKVQAVVADVGPVAVAMFASESFKNYAEGIFDDYNCTGEAGHAVLIVGYGTDSSTGKDYWIIKNSWGTTWGIDGYALIVRNKGMCGIGSQDVNYPFLVSDKLNSGEMCPKD